MNVPGPRRFRNILIAGLPGVGKSTFARAYAQMSRTELVELDRYVERLAGKSISAIFADDGEATFRQLEASCLERLMKRQRCTIALGGGTLSHPASLKMAQELGCIVLLTAPIEMLVKRLWPEKESRPLLAECQTEAELAERLAQLWEMREGSYLQADIKLETAFSSIDTLKIELAWLEQSMLSQKAGAVEIAAEIFHRQIPLADADYRSPREQRGSKEISDKMERLLKAQRQKDRGDKRDKRDKRTQLPRRAEAPEGQKSRFEGASTQSDGPRPQSDGPRPQSDGPRPQSDGPRPQSDGPRPQSDGPRPQSDGPRPQSDGPRPQSGGPRPQSEGPRPQRSSPRAQGDATRPQPNPQRVRQEGELAKNENQKNLEGPKPRDVGPTPRGELKND